MPILSGGRGDPKKKVKVSRPIQGRSGKRGPARFHGQSPAERGMVFVGGKWINPTVPDPFKKRKKTKPKGTKPSGTKPKTTKPQRPHGSRPPATNRPSNPGVGSGGGGGRGGGGGGGRGGGAGGGGGGGGRGGGGGGKKKGGSSGVIKPKQYADALTKLQFGSLISELQRQRDDAQLQGEQNLADIRQMYGDVSAQAASSMQSNDQFADQMLDRSTDDASAILASLGGGANQGAGVAAGFQQLMQGALQGIGQAHHGYDSAQGTLIDQSKAQAILGEQRFTDETTSDLSAKLADALSQKGAAAVKNRFDAQQMRLQQMAAIQNMQLLGAESGLKMQGMRLQNQNMSLTNQALGQQLANKFKKTGFGKLTAGDRAKLGQGANRVMYDPSDGSASLHPEKAWVKMANLLRSLGYDARKNPKVRGWMSQMWLNYVTDFNADHDNKYEPRKNGTPYLKW